MDMNMEVSKVAEMVAHETERAILGTIEQWVEDGVIELHVEQAFLSQEPNPFSAEGPKLKYNRKVRLVLKEQELIDRLKDENKKLREALSNLEGV